MDHKYAGEIAFQRLIELIKDNYMFVNDVITNDEIDEICGATIYTGDEVEL